ncbi:transcriptional regulator, TetR family [Glycomyces sambucus]|uniref:Transcriptional regulator, TetR family n=1 Tax=Glycomyces sambucus TaxID=380244 RepID=A0A1G9CQG8_9ACTN|nr:TetR/AcrR family transcriptional regulator [Glycomyces sambucus]SDK53839.1 transcriptional regulator, TetR family [Glycomyces sambucus]
MSAKRRGRPRNEAARTQIVEAATALFLRDGYTGTTVGAVADAAGVAVQTIYSAYASKVGVLAAVHDSAIAGGEPLPLLERDWALGLAGEATAAAAWDQTVLHVAQATEQVAPVFAVIESAAADPEVAELLKELHGQRHRFSVALAERLLPLPGARPDADPARVADLLYATLSVATYLPLVVERGWPMERWRAWVHEVGGREVLAGTP